MTRSEMIEIVDQICDECGYEDCPAYDLIYSDCVAGRPYKDAIEMIKDLLADFNK